MIVRSYVLMEEITSAQVFSTARLFAVSSSTFPLVSFSCVFLWICGYFMFIFSGHGLFASGVLELQLMFLSGSCIQVHVCSADKQMLSCITFYVYP